jgi:hypothetical protein
MLKRFSVQNFKNFEKKITIDFTASNYEYNKFCIADDISKIIKTAIIVGKNASGKSNLIIAIFDLISNITEFESGLHHYSQFINLNTDINFAEFEYEFIFDNDTITYHYGKTDKSNIIFESLKINDRQVAHIDRRENNIASFNFDADVDTVEVTDNIFLCKYLENRLNNENNQLIKCYFKFINFVKSMLCFTSLERNSYIGLIPSNNGDIFELIAKIEKNDLTKFQSFLSDLGINYNLEIIKLGNNPTVGVRFKQGLVMLSNIASTGTKTLSLFYHWFTQLNKVKFLAIDEFDAFYHFELSYSIVKKLRELHDIQVILTTHNTSLISNDLLRPDCYYTLDIIQNELFKFSDATDKKLREIHSLEKMYRAGKFDHKYTIEVEQNVTNG